MKNENVLIWGFCGEDGKVILDHLRSYLNIVDWFSDQEGSIDIWNILQGRFFNSFTPFTNLDEFSNFFNAYFHTYNVMISRRGLKFSDLHELVNEFTMSYHYFANLILKKNVQLIIFANLPHEGPDYVLYQVAKMLKVKTLICYQNIFSNQFFMMTSLADFGVFNTVPKIFGDQSLSLEPGFKQKVSYMQDIEKRQLAITGGGLGFILFRLKKAVRKISLMLVGLIRIALTPKRINLKSLARKIETFHFKYVYRKNNIKHTVSQVVLNNVINSSSKIAYFPLHLQPELTTSAIGGIFQDQLLAIETLRSLLNDNWVILVKENPKQGYFQRGDLFFNRLSHIPGVYWVDRFYPSEKILEKATLTAVISGTAGWEAIKGGGKCIVFGQAWYSSLPGCIKYYDGITNSELINFLSSKHTFLQVKNMFNLLSKKAGTGVVDPEYKSLVDGYTPEGNATLVAHSLMAVIRSSETVW